MMVLGAQERQTAFKTELTPWQPDAHGSQGEDGHIKRPDASPAAKKKVVSTDPKPKAAEGGDGRNP